ncbi:MAG TPA: ATP-binding protein, partial [Segeticoccus sp.]|uniref:sensor histidine kinase n=1 Tax=Segeticoccus sp. TaxID=2706531 RepID=UPI002D808231
SARAKIPLRDAHGRIIGAVSVGIAYDSVHRRLLAALPDLLCYAGAALAVGIVAAVGLSRRLRRRTHGVAFADISALLAEREAMLHGIREGVIAFDADGLISVVNDEAQRLLGLHMGVVGRSLDEVLPHGRLRAVLAGEEAAPDATVLTDDFCLVINRMPVTIAGRPHGAVVTLRDRTEAAGLLRELDGERSLTESLRAQQHEFANRMQAVAGLLELGLTDEALCYILEVRGTAAEFDNTLRTRVAAPQVVGLLLGKAAEASERGIELTIAPETWLSDAPDKAQALTSIIGNLIDNAFDALSDTAPPRSVVLGILEEDDFVTVTVADNGPGVPPGAAELIFRDGFTTKERPTATRGGLGLALVHRLVIRLHGSVTVSEGPGAEFTVRLPRHPAPVGAEVGQP